MHREEKHLLVAGGRETHLCAAVSSFGVFGGPRSPMETSTGLRCWRRELCLQGQLSPFKQGDDPDISLTPPGKAPAGRVEGDPRETGATSHTMPMTGLVLVELHRYSQTQI